MNEVNYLSDLNTIILATSSTLRITGEDFSKSSFESAKNDIKKRLEIFWHTRFDDEALAIAEEGAAGDYLKFYEAVAGCQAKLANVLYLNMRYKKHPVSCANISYLGQGSDECIKLFRCISSDSAHLTVKNVVPYFEDATMSLANCLEKQLLFIMFIAYEFRLYDLAGVIALIFLCGGV